MKKLSKEGVVGGLRRGDQVQSLASSCAKAVFVEKGHGKRERTGEVLALERRS